MRAPGWSIVPLLALLCVARAAPARAAARDTTADAEVGQGDFVHATTPSFIRKRSLDLQGDPRGNGVAIDVAHSPSPIYVADANTNRVLGWHDVAAFTDGADADLVIGAPDFYTNAFGCQRTPTGFCTPLALAVDAAGDLYVSGDHVEKFAAPFSQVPPVSGTEFVPAGSVDPWGVAIDSHGNVYVAARNQSEVLEYDSGSTTPHLVFGQPSASGGACNQGGMPSATTLCTPYAVAVDGLDNLYVADSGNHRVLVFHTPLDAGSGQPGAGDTAADLVIGQSGFTTASPATTDTGLFNPRGLAVDGPGSLWVADTANHRVTEYDAPLATGAAATLVVGQPDATSGSCNQGGPVGAGTLCNPTGVAIDQANGVYVYDANNNRVVAFAESNPPRTKTATRVLGQHDPGHATRNFVDATTVNADAIAIDRSANPNHLYVVDALNNRVLGYASASTFTNGGAADLVLGQPDLFSNGCDGGASNDCSGPGSVTANVLGLNYFGFEGVAIDSQGDVWVSDPKNRRVVGYAAPFSSGMAANQAATKVLGEPDLTTAAGGIGCNAVATSTCSPKGLAIDASDDLYVVDGENGRVLEFDTPWTYAGALPQPASLVFGQGSTGTNFAGTGCNQDGESADSLCEPVGLAIDGHGDLWVADGTNHRVLEYDRPLPFGGGTPGTPGAAGDVTADFVLGQGGAFETADCPGFPLVDATSLCAPIAVAVDPFGSVFVTDSGHHRVLGYAEPANPPRNATAGIEFGHGTTGDDFAHDAANDGGLGPASLYLYAQSRVPGVALDSAGDLFVADTGNSRLLRFDGGFLGAPVPTTTTSAPATTSTTSTSSSSTTTTTILTVLPPPSCPDAAAAAAIEASVEARCDCAGARNHGAFVRCAAMVARDAVKAGTLTKACKHAVISCAKHSTCGKPGFVTCCRTSAKGRSKCSIKSQVGLCKPVRGGTACVGRRPSCCDACGNGGCVALTAGDE